MRPETIDRPTEVSPARLERFHRNVSVVVLNYQRPEITLQCLDALYDARSSLIKEIIVVDNGSDSATIATLEERVDDMVRIVPLGVNRYFGEGNNWEPRRPPAISWSS